MSAEPDNGARFYRRVLWINELIACETLAPTTKLVGIRLATFQNMRSGQLNPSAATIAKAVACSVREVRRQIAALDRAGWIAKTGRRGRVSNAYELLFPYPPTVTTVTGLDDLNGDNGDTVNGDNGDTVEGCNGDKSGMPTVTNPAPNGVNGDTLTRENKEKNKSAVRSLAALTGGSRTARPAPNDDASLVTPEHARQISARAKAFWQAKRKGMAMTPEEIERLADQIVAQIEAAGKTMQ